mgnify:CR=1 FL=1
MVRNFFFLSFLFSFSSCTSVKIKSPTANKENIKPVDVQEIIKKTDINLDKEVKEFLEKKPPLRKEKKNIPQKQIKKKKEALPMDYPLDFIQWDRESEEIWQKVSWREKKESFKMDLKYWGAICGSVLISNLGRKILEGKDVLHFQARLKSADFYSFIYEVDDRIDSYVDFTHKTPLRFELNQKETKQVVSDLQLFNREKRRTYAWYHRLKKGVETKYTKKEYIPFYFQDSFSILFFIRYLPLEMNSFYQVPVVTRGKIWLIKVWVVNKESLTIEDVSYESIKLRVETHFPGVLSKKGDIEFWFSDDERRIPLKFSAKVKIGSVEGVYTRKN